MNFLWQEYPHYILKVFYVEGRQVFEVEFSHTPAAGAIVRRVERKQLWYSLVSFFWNVLPISRQVSVCLYSNEIKIQNFF